jgi:prophage antirepressor-like protein
MLTPTAGGEQMVKFIPEGDLYRLIVRSKANGIKHVPYE